MNKESLQRYIDEGIVPAVAMGFRVEECDVEKRLVVLSAPLELNRNDKGTAFAGSSASLGTLCCWSVAQSLANIAVADVANTSTSPSSSCCVPVVAKETHLKYLHPIANCDRIVARCHVEDQSVAAAFVSDYRQKHKSYITLSSVVYPENNPQIIGLSLTGTFVALPSN